MSSFCPLMKCHQTVSWITTHGVPTLRCPEHRLFVRRHALCHHGRQDPAGHVRLRTALRARELGDVSTARELLLLPPTDPGPGSFLHHVMTFLLLILGQMTVYHVPTPKLFRLCDWLILQATLEQPTYAAMALYHSATYLRLQDAKEQGFKRRLRLATGLMKFMRWFTWPQKVCPCRRIRPIGRLTFSLYSSYPPLSPSTGSHEVRCRVFHLLRCS